jgi:hypothetical protein
MDELADLRHFLGNLQSRVKKRGVLRDSPGIVQKCPKKLVQNV